MRPAGSGNIDALAQTDLEKPAMERPSNVTLVSDSNGPYQVPTRILYPNNENSPAN